MSLGNHCGFTPDVTFIAHPTFHAKGPLLGDYKVQWSTLRRIFINRGRSIQHPPDYQLSNGGSSQGCRKSGQGPACDLKVRPGLRPVA